MTHELAINTNESDDSLQYGMQVTNEARAVAEVQAAFVIAKKFPRNEMLASVKIIEACKRPYLAEQSQYAYPRGKTTVTGVSIRLAEVLAQYWTNIQVGVQIISQTKERTDAVAFCIDLENNFKCDTPFLVNHVRNTKHGTQILTDERDIRELVANIGSRAIRQSILRIIPGDVVEAAKMQCDKTLASSEVPIKELIRQMVTRFDEIGVKLEQIEKHLGHNIDATIMTEIVQLKKIYKSIKDGVATRNDFFEFSDTFATKPQQQKTNDLLDFLAKNQSEGQLNESISVTPTNPIQNNSTHVDPEASQETVLLNESDTVDTAGISQAAIHDSPRESLPEKITPEQQAYIQELFTEKQFSDERIAKALSTCKVAHVNELTYEKAVKFIKRLESI